MTRLDRQIREAQDAVIDAFARKNTQAIHHSVNRLTALRTKRLRRERFWRNVRA